MEGLDETQHLETEPGQHDASDASSKTKSQNYMEMLVVLENCAKILEEVLREFLSDQELETVQDCLDNSSGNENELDKRFKNYDKFHKDLRNVNLHRPGITDLLIFHDILNIFFIKGGRSFESLSKLKSFRNSLSHPDGGKDAFPQPVECFETLLGFIEDIANEYTNVFNPQCIEQLRSSAFEYFRQLSPFHQEPPVMSDDLKNEIQYYESCNLLNWAKSALEFKANGKKPNTSECLPNLSVTESCLIKVLENLNDAKCSKVVFLVGDSGTGKSHLAQSVALSWLSQSDQRLKEFKLVLFVEVCDVKSTVYCYLTKRYPKIFKYMERLDSCDSKEETFLKFWQQWGVLVIIDGFCSKFPHHGKVLQEITELFPSATLMVTANGKDMTTLTKLSLRSQREIKTVIIDSLNYDQANDLAREVLSFLRPRCGQTSNLCDEFTLPNSKHLRCPLDIILFCIVLHITSQNSQQEPYTYTQSSLVAQLCDVCLQIAPAEYLKFSEAIETAALQNFFEINSSYSDVAELDTEESLEFHYPVIKMQEATSHGKTSYRFPNKCFLQHFAVKAIAKSYKGKVKELENNKMFCNSPRSFYLRLECMLQPLINYFAKHRNLTLEIAKILNSVRKFNEDDMLFWMSIIPEGGPKMPVELGTYFDEHLPRECWVINEKNYEACFACFQCMSTPPQDIKIDLLQCEEINALESLLLLFEEVSCNSFKINPVDTVLFYHSKATPLRLRLPSWIKLKKFEGAISKEDVSAVLQCPDLTSVSFMEISQLEVLTALIGSIMNASEELQEISLQLNASIASSFQSERSLPEIETLNLQVRHISDENFGCVIHMLQKLVPRNNAGTIITLRSEDLNATHCRKLIEDFSKLQRGCISVYSGVALTQQEKDQLKLLCHHECDGLYRWPHFQLCWNDEHL